jgi:hypothetical protein
MQAFPAPLLLAALVAAGSPAAAATALHPAAHAAAKSEGVSSDVRCLLTMVAVANINKDHPQAAQFGIYFFVGRINARAPGLDLAAAVKAQAPTLGPQQLQAEAQRCGPIVNAAGQNFQAAIASLRPPGAPPQQQQQPAPAPAPATPPKPPLAPPAATPPK